MKRAILAEKLWIAAQTDAGLIAELREAYRGRLDAQDALWWRANPLTPTPAGRPDPGAEVTALQAAIYSRTPSAEGPVEFVDPTTGESVRATESEHRLRTLTHQLAQDAAAVDAVLDRFQDWTETAADGDDDGEAARAVASLFRAGQLREDANGPNGPNGPNYANDGNGPNGPNLSPEESTSDAAVPGHRRRTLGLLAVGAAVGVLATMGVQAIQGQVGPTDATPITQLLAEYNESNPPTDDAAASLSNVLQIFDQLAAFPDGQVPDLGPAYLPESIRGIFDVRGEGYSIYVAQRGTSQYCIIVQDADQTASSACAGASVIAQEGLTVNAVVLGSIPGLDEGPATLTDVTVTWSSDGEFSSSSTPRPKP